MTNYADVLTAKYPGTIWILSGDTYDDLTWLDDSPKPTQVELDAMWNDVRTANQRKQIERVRQQAYATSSDPIFFQFQRGDATEKEWLDAVQAVKDAHPYPA